MPMTLTEAATEVCRTIGSQNDAVQIAAAKTALKFAVREMNQRHNWSFKLTENTALAITGGTQDYVVTGAKKIYGIGFGGSNPRWLVYVRQRDWDRAMRFAQQTGDFMFYTVKEDGAGVITVRLFTTPAGSGNATVRYYTDITVPLVDGNNIDVPERFLGVVLALGNAYYLANRDAENPRTGYWRSQAEVLLQKAIEDDVEAPDEDLVISDWQYFEGARLGRRDSMLTWEDW